MLIFSLTSPTVLSAMQLMPPLSAPEMLLMTSLLDVRPGRVPLLSLPPFRCSASYSMMYEDLSMSVSQTILGFGLPIAWQVSSTVSPSLPVTDDGSALIVGMSVNRNLRGNIIDDQIDTFYILSFAIINDTFLQYNNVLHLHTLST